MHQSHTGPRSDRQNSGLAAEVENITERLSSEPGDGSPAIAFQMQQIAERISKLEQKERDQKVNAKYASAPPPPDPPQPNW